MLNITLWKYSGRRWTDPDERGRYYQPRKNIKRNQKIGRVYQNPAMGTCPTMTILENMSLADNKGKFFGLGSGNQ